jgi:hypothetical protein
LCLGISTIDLLPVVSCLVHIQRCFMIMHMRCDVKLAKICSPVPVHVWLQWIIVGQLSCCTFSSHAGVSDWSVSWRLPARYWASCARVCASVVQTQCIQHEVLLLQPCAYAGAVTVLISLLSASAAAAALLLVSCVHYTHQSTRCCQQQQQQQHRYCTR